MQVTVESPSQIQRRVTIVVPFEKWDQSYDQRIKKLSQSVKIDGFRPGKVPLRLIQQRYGHSVRQEALSEVIENSLFSAINQEKLHLVGVPSVEPKTAIPGQPLEFIATFEVIPEVEKVNFHVDHFEKQTITITEEDIEKAVERLCKQQTNWVAVDRPAQEKDQVKIDFLGKIDGVPFKGGEAHEYAIVLGSKTMIPGFEEGIIGMSTGEEKIISVTFPEDYFSKELAGKMAEFTIKAIKVEQPELPSIDTAFVKKLGIASGEINDLHADIRKHLENDANRAIKLKLKKQVFDILLEQNPIEVPKALIEQETKRIHDELHPHHQHDHHEHAHTEAEITAMNDSAKRNVTLGILIGAFVKQHALTIDTARVQAWIDIIASSYEDPNEVKKWYSNNKKAMSEVNMQILEEQVTEKLLLGVQVTEKVLTYNELVAQKNT